MAGINFQITGDSRQLQTSVSEAQRALNNLYQQIQQGAGSVDNSMERASSSVEKFAKRVAAAFAGIKIAEWTKKISKDILETRKEYQSIELALSNLLGSAEKGAALFQQITKFAVETPMNEKDVANGAQTLLGFGVAAEKVMPILKQLGDVSMADSQRFQSLVLVMAQVAAVGKLQGQDLLQFVNAGFNPLNEMVQMTGRSMSNLRDAMSKGEISYEMVQQALAHATSEGGKFNGMLNTMAQGLAGSQAALRGTVQKLENDIGQRMEQTLVGAMNTANTALQGVMNNLDVYKAALVSIIAVLGTYKATQLSVAAVNTITAGGTQALTKALIQQKIATAAAALEQKAFNLIISMNPYVAAATALAALCGVVYTFSQRTTGAEYAQRSLNDVIAEADSAQEKYNNQIQTAITTATNDAAATSDRQAAMQLLCKQYDTIIAKYIDEKGHLKDIIKLKQEIALLDGKKTVSKLQDKAAKYDQYANAAKKGSSHITGNYGVGLYKGAGANSYGASEKDKQLQEAYAEYRKQTGATFATDKDVQDYFFKMASGLRNEANKRQTAAQVASYREGLGQLSSDDLKTMQRTLVNTEAELKKAQKQSKNKVVANVSGIGKGLDVDQVKTINSQIAGILAARNDKAAKDAKDTKKTKTTTAGKTTKADEKEAKRKAIADKLTLKIDIDTKEAKEQLEQLNHFPVVTQLQFDIEKAQKEYEKALNDSSATADTKVQLATNLANLQAQLDDLTHGNLTIKAEVEPDYIKKGSLQDIEKSYSNAQEQAAKIQTRFDNGIIDQATASQQISEINAKLATLGANLKPLTLQVKYQITYEKNGIGNDKNTDGNVSEKRDSYNDLKSSFDTVQSDLNTGIIDTKTAKEEVAKINAELAKIGEGIEPFQLQIETKGFKHSINQVEKGFGVVQNTVNGFQNLTSAIENSDNAWQQVTGVMSAFFQIADGVTSIITGVISIIQLLSGATEEQTQKQEQQNIAQITGTAATIAQATASGTAAATETAETIATEANTKAKGSEAIANATSSGAKMPFPYNLIAIGTGVAAVIAALASCFATGGIVPGASTTGDKVIARVNSGEMILNKSQQANLFKMINAGYTPATTIQQVALPQVDLNASALKAQLKNANDYMANVNFKLAGRDLIGAIQNTSKLAAKSGRNYQL